MYAAAQQESVPLQVFCGGDTGSQGDGVRTACAQTFPDIPLSRPVDLSKYHNNRIDRAHLEGIHVADVAVLQTLQHFRRWKSEGKLLAYKPATFEDIIGEEKDADGEWYAETINGSGTFVFDSTKINASQVPTSYVSLPDPAFRGKLILTYPHDDDAVNYLFSLRVGRYGFQWLYDLAQNDVKWTNVSEAPEQYMSWAQTGAIIAGTPRPESAKSFMLWLVSEQRQNETAAAAGRSSVLNSVNIRYGGSPYGSNVTQLPGYRVYEQNRADVEWWKNLYGEVLGTPQGRDSLEVYPKT